METFSALLAICAGNSPVPGEFPTQRPVTRSFDVYFDLRPNKRLSKQSLGWWFETLSHPLWRHRNVISSASSAFNIQIRCEKGDRRDQIFFALILSFHAMFMPTQDIFIPAWTTPRPWFPVTGNPYCHVQIESDVCTQVECTRGITHGPLTRMRIQRATGMVNRKYFQCMANNSTSWSLRVGLRMTIYEEGGNIRDKKDVVKCSD